VQAADPLLELVLIHPAALRSRVVKRAVGVAGCWTVFGWRTWWCGEDSEDLLLLDTLSSGKRIPVNAGVASRTGRTKRWGDAPREVDDLQRGTGRAAKRGSVLSDARLNLTDVARRAGRARRRRDGLLILDHVASAGAKRSRRRTPLEFADAARGTGRTARGGRREGLEPLHITDLVRRMRRTTKRGRRRQWWGATLPPASVGD